MRTRKRLKKKRPIKRRGLARVSDAADFLSLARGTLYKGINNGSIPFVRIGGNVRLSWEWIYAQVPKMVEDKVQST